jgi:CHAT domain-containing protein
MAYNTRDKDTGDSYFEECAGLSRQMNTAYSQAQILSLKAYRFESETELDSALVYYRKAMVINDTVDKSGSVDNLNSIANIYISMGEFGLADDVLSKAILLARDISDSLALGSTLQFSSFLYSRTAEFRKGLSNNDSAIAIFNKSGHIIRLANTYASRGTLLSSMGENKLSIQAQLYADSLYKEEMQEEQRGILFNNIGTVYTSQGDYNTALKYLQKSLAVLPKGVISESYLLTQGNVAECYLGLKRNNEAKALLLQYLPMAQKMKLNRIASGMALVLGKTYLEENDPVKAAAYYSYAKQYAAASGEKEKSVDALVNLGRIYGKENKTDQAAASLREAGSLALQYKLNGGWEAYYELGILTYQVQQYDSAVVFFKQAVGLLEDQAEKLYGGDAARKIFNNDPRKADLYNKITFSYYKMGNINQAWAYANRSNIAGIRELSGSLSVNSTDEEKNEVLRQLFSMQQAKKALEQNMLTQQGQARLETLKKIEILEKDYTNFLQDVVKRFPELKDYFQGADADEFNKYKTKLPADMAVALFVLNDKNLMIFTLTREKLSVDTMTVDIAGRISAFIELIKNTGKPTGTGPLSTRSDPMDEDKTSVTGNFRDISDELYSVLISQVYNKIGGKRKWCIIPSGVFSNLPFQCLGKKTEDGAFHFLAEEHTIFYTNKISIFGEPAPPQGGPAGSFAAFGVPDAVLKYNISEVKNIGKIIGSDSTVYTDARATERMAKQSLLNKKYIHFATHGVLNYTTDYTESYLKLLPDKDSTDGNNGKLTMREIQSLGITDCDMVILSACQTAVSIQLVRGWNISPANSFLVSNVKTVVASLWKVADEPTGLLMEYFYENMKTMEKSEALRQAQIRLSQDPRFVHPNYWGAFVLYGDWR